MHSYLLYFDSAIVQHVLTKIFEFKIDLMTYVHTSKERKMVSRKDSNKSMRCTQDHDSFLHNM